VSWIVVGILLYLGYFQQKEEMERPKEVLHQEALVSVDYSVLVPVATVEQAHELGRLGALLAKAHRGEVMALNVVKVPIQLSLSDGRLFLKERRPILEAAIEEAQALDVHAHTMLRLGRSVSEGIMKTAVENASDLLVFGWPGVSGTDERLIAYGSVMDRIVANPPADVIILRSRPFDKVQRILVPVAGGPNGRLAVRTAVALARSMGEETEVVLLNVLVEGINPETARARAQNTFRRLSDRVTYPLQTKMVSAANPIDGIVGEAVANDMIIIGATKEPLFRNLLLGNVSQRVADQAPCPVLIVKRRSGIISSVLRETVLDPVVLSDKLPDKRQRKSKS
jgi:nucleotide-binding universal stress UspA family protein